MEHTSDDIIAFRQTLWRLIKNSDATNDEMQYKELILIDNFLEGLLIEGKV